MGLPLFRIFYSTTFTILTLLLIGLVLITPGDTIYQAYRDRQYYYISVIGGAYVLTFISAILIYASRLYTNRVVLAGIPKTWIPVEKGDVSKRVWRVIADGLTRSTMISFKVRPRNTKDEEASPILDNLGLHLRRNSLSREASHRGQDGLSYALPALPSWGLIAHDGWSSPSSDDLPNLQYEPVIVELPHLIEAKAVSLAPPDPAYPSAVTPDGLEAPVFIPDARVVESLQRPVGMGLRDYILYLTNMDLIEPPSLGAKFLAIYENARFSGLELTEYEFRTLMGVFAEILRNMKGLDSNILENLLSQDLSASSGSQRGDVRSVSTRSERLETHQVTQIYERNSFASTRSRSESRGTVRTPRSYGLPQESDMSFNAAAAPSSPHILRTTSGTSLSPSPSMGSSKASMRSSSSVIRLAEARTPLDLPYTITVTRTESPK